MQSFAVFCGSAPGSAPEYLAAARDVGTALAQQQRRLVYGGGERGLMGAVCSATLSSGGAALGVLPRIMVKAPTRGPNAAAGTGSAEGAGPMQLDNGTEGTQRLTTVLVPDMHARKLRMANESDAFLVLPGGYGSFEEAFEMITWTQLGIQRKPVVFLNVNNFYDPLLALVERGVSEGFITSAGRALITLVSEADASSAGSWGAAAILAAEKLGPEIQAAGSGYWNWSASQNGAKQPADVTQLASAERAVDVKDLTFAFTQEREPALVDCNLSLSRGSRCLLIGANGAGKSTLLRLLAGKRLPGRDAHVRVYGKDVFHDAPRGIVYLGTEWAMNPVVRGDIRVSHFLDSVGGFRHKARRDRLLDILDVDISWRMHQISDGERRRVQLTMGLMEEWDVLLLDEVTVDLDVQVRADLLKFLRSETEERGATIIYATHIFDGLSSFPTHILHMQMGRTTSSMPITWPPRADGVCQDALPVLDESGSDADALSEGERGTLLPTALAWLRADRELRIKTERESGNVKRGAKAGQVDTDSETFYKKYDYNN
ncbi:hypothetical protein FA09DRAFT_331468 [Tilletiopsis washingtonensis]|uniref:ABC transporter domain-containing protein n=1 Tax=Tilletiopsis washingtonensis TaxID=58919 RepID=A0A316Z5I3_9BASI|nr:hypothetical protein FA09DRAFT_331468 [Tilletiopsis washingtonensis]PWN96228.1 hypothetical protein FA09DRAFT_331468 [Tilletiopsis washingtonensis]